VRNITRAAVTTGVSPALDSGGMTIGVYMRGIISGTVPVGCLAVCVLSRQRITMSAKEIMSVKQKATQE
jgi:hypothetical protein